MPPSNTTEISLMKQNISMLTDKVDLLAKNQKEESDKAQAHREEFLKLHANLLEKLEQKFAGKWTEKVLVYVGGLILTAVITAIMALVIMK